MFVRLFFPQLVTEEEGDFRLLQLTGHAGERSAVHVRPQPAAAQFYWHAAKCI